MVTKTEFEEAYRKFPPDKCELFFMKYISIHSVKENRWLLVFLPFFLFLPFFTELFFCIFKFPIIAKIIPTTIYILILSGFGVYWLLVYLKKKKRLEKVRKHLNITRQEYQDLVNAYFYNRYRSTEKYIKYNSK